MSPRLIFVCQGNICRSTMAEQVARHWADEAGLEVGIDSAGVSDEERGNPIDPRARRCLLTHGCDPGTHRAHQITAAEIAAADLVMAAEHWQLQRMRKLVPESVHLHLITDFDPHARPQLGVRDPWYGGMEGFEDTLEAIESAMPGILDAVRALG